MIRVAVLDEYDRFHLPCRQPVFVQQQFAGFRLQGGEADILLPVSFDNKVHTAVTEVAHTIEQYDRLLEHVAKLEQMVTLSGRLCNDLRESLIEI